MRQVSCVFRAPLYYGCVLLRFKIKWSEVMLTNILQTVEGILIVLDAKVKLKYIQYSVKCVSRTDSRTIVCLIG